MSIHVTVKNDDSREGAVIGVKTQWLDADGKVQGDGTETELKGGPDNHGESMQLLVHASQQIVVREIRQP
jgi:hypothetical protein